MVCKPTTGKSFVRDLKRDSESESLFFDCNIYVCQATEKAEPLFFAPCFTGAAVRVYNGIHYFSRVYYRTVSSFHDHEAAKEIFEAAKTVIAKKTESRKKRKGAQEEVKYLEELPGKWSNGLRKLRKNTDELAAFFLGDPIPLPRPVKKNGFMIPIGFSMSLEQLMKEATSQCLTYAATMRAGGLGLIFGCQGSGRFSACVVA